MPHHSSSAQPPAPKLRLGHSPDSDDAFMFYPLAQRLLDTGGLEFEHVLQDIQTLNQWAVEGRLEITAISVHAYAHVHQRYALLNAGASMGVDYGPVVVARAPTELEALRSRRIAVPGLLTSAYLALRLRLAEFDPVVVPFDRIMHEVAAGAADAGLLIHEGQLTHGQLGLHAVEDLGRWWRAATGLPLPLGVNAIRRDLPAPVQEQAARLLRQSIAYALEHRDDALTHALRYARGMDRSLADRFVGMYVNEWTLDLGDTGRESIRLFLRRGYERGVLPELPGVDFVG